MKMACGHTLISISLGGIDFGKYSIDTETGILTYKPDDTTVFTYKKKDSQKTINKEEVFIMKKVLIILLSLALIITLAACGSDGGKTPSENSAPSESGNKSSAGVKADENKYYGIGEAAEIDGFEITIDKIEIVDDFNIFKKYVEGYKYVKVYVTAKNISDESQTARNPLLCIVRDGVNDPELSNDSRNRDVWGHEVEGMYYDEYIAPGETNSGFMVFQLKPDEKEIIMKYNVLYNTDVRFKIQIP